MSVKELATNPKVAGAVVAATAGTGLTTYLEILPAEAGTIASLAGAALSTVLIFTNLLKAHQDRKLHRKQIDWIETKLRQSNDEQGYEFAWFDEKDQLPIQKLHELGLFDRKNKEL